TRTVLYFTAPCSIPPRRALSHHAVLYLTAPGLLPGLPDELSRGQLVRSDREGLTALPLDDDRNSADASSVLVVADTPGSERARRGSAGEVELGHRLADRLGIGRLRPLGSFLDDPDVRVAHQWVLGHEWLAGPLLEALDQLLLALEWMRGHDGL